MDDNARAGDVTTELGRSHRVNGPFRETTWSGQWIAMCSCGRGIRCNDEDSAVAFLEEGGCI